MAARTACLVTAIKTVLNAKWLLQREEDDSLLLLQATEPVVQHSSIFKLTSCINLWFWFLSTDSLLKFILWLIDWLEMDGESIRVTLQFNLRGFCEEKMIEKLSSKWLTKLNWLVGFVVNRLTTFLMIFYEVSGSYDNAVSCHWELYTVTVLVYTYK